VVTHAPPAYACPFCRVVAGESGEWNVPGDVVHREGGTTAFVAPKWWPRNAGHVLVVPDRHVENLYEITPDELSQVYVTARLLAAAMREAYECDGTSTRQHNEPAGNQDVWHFHVHVFPRYDGDDLYVNHERTRWVGADERAPYAHRLRERLVAAEGQASA
jgi:histidine triad (HIT) family protein